MARHCTYRQEVLASAAVDESEVELADTEVVIDVDQFDGRIYLLIQNCVPIPEEES